MKESLLKELEQCKRSDIADIVEYFKNDEEFFNNILANFVGTDVDTVENYMKKNGLSAKVALHNSIIDFKDEIQEEMEGVRELYAREFNAIADELNLTYSDISPELADYLKENADEVAKEQLSGAKLYSRIISDVNSILKEKGLEIRENNGDYDGINSDFSVFYSPGGNKATEYIGYDGFESYAKINGRIYDSDIISEIKNASGVDIDELCDEEQEILYDMLNSAQDDVLSDFYNQNTGEYLEQLTNSLAECGIDNDVAVVHRKGKDWYVVPVFEELEPFEEVYDSVMLRKVLTPEQIEQSDKCVKALKEAVIYDIANYVINSEFFQEILESVKNNHQAEMR